MSVAKHIIADITRALTVLGLVFLCFAGAPTAGLDDQTVAQQAGSVGTAYTSLCGGDHGQPQLACHAPDACCRPDQALVPPRTISPEPAYRPVAAVQYAAFQFASSLAARAVIFRSRAPPV